MKRAKMYSKMAKISILGSMVNGVLGLNFLTQEMCMMNLGDRLDCVLDPMVTREECTRRDCCYDSNVPEGVPLCYFALEVDRTDTLQAELNAKPLSMASGVFHSAEDDDILMLKEQNYQQLVNSVLNNANEDIFVQEAQLDAQLETCDINVWEMGRCGRRGVPRKRCVELGCCWNANWRPGGMFGPRCHKTGISDEEHTYNNGKMDKIELEDRNIPVTIDPLGDLPDDMRFISDNLNAKVEKLKVEGCKPNHNQLQCIQGVTDRLKCDISEELNMGIEACTACTKKKCCFDPEPKIIAGMIYPICFEHGPIMSDELPEDWHLEATDEIPEQSVSDDDFDKMLAILEGGDDEIQADPQPMVVELSEDQKERKLRRERYDEFRNLGLIHDSPDVEVGNLFQPPQSIINFPGHNPNAFQPKFDESFTEQKKEISMMGDMLWKDREQLPDSRTDAIKQLLSSIDPTLAMYIGDNGSMNLGSLDDTDAGWKALNTDQASQQLYETIKNNQKSSNNPIKPGSPILPPSPTPNVVQVPMATTTTKPEYFSTQRVVTRPPIQSSIEGYKRQMVEQQVQAEKNILIKAGIREPVLSAQLDRKRVTLERKFGLSKPSATASPIPQTTTTFLNKYEELEMRLENQRHVLRSQGYFGDQLEFELQKFRRQIAASLGITTPAPIRTTTTTRAPTTTQATLPFVPATDGSVGKTCFPTQCGVPSELNANLKKIVGGQETGNIKYWPWQASLRRSFTDDPSFYHLCGATLISESWILTAAHCFIRYTKKMKIDVRMMEPDSSKYLINLGRYTKNQFEYNMQPRALSYFIAHPDFQPWIGNQMHDIAVARLHRPIEVTDYVRPVCLPQFVPPVDGKIYITGWGNTKKVGANGNKLKELILPLATQEVCENQWKGYFNDGWICTDPGFLEDACQGDSGGPAVYFDQFQKRFNIVGVTIAGSETCSTSRATVKAGVYSNVLYYKNFINQATSNGCR